MRQNIGRLLRKLSGRPGEMQEAAADAEPSPLAADAPADATRPEPERNGGPQPLWSVAELASVTGGEWLREPGAAWNPRNVRSTVLTEIQTAWLPRSIIFVSTERRLKKRFEHEAPPPAEPTGCLVVDRKLVRSPHLPEDRAVLVVDDTLAALRALAARARERLQGEVLVVTGTAGKTSTRAMLVELLKARGDVVTNLGEGAFRVHVFQQMASARPETRSAVFELGLGGPRGSFRDVSAVVRPHVVLLTELDVAHLDNISLMPMTREKALRAVAQHKMMAAARLADGGAIVVNRDMAGYEDVVEAAGDRRIVTFGGRDEADFRLLDVRKEDGGVQVRVQGDGEPFEYRLPLQGRFMAMNSLGALAAAAQVGCDIRRRAASLARLKPLPGRARIVPLELGGARFTLIDDSYDASPLTMRAALELLEETEPGAEGRRIALLGNMSHAGTRSQAAYAELASVAVARGVDRIYTLGSDARHLQQALPPEVAAGHFETSGALLEALIRDLRDGDVVTIKASIRSRFSRIVSELEGLARLAPTQPDPAPVALLSPAAASGLVGRQPEIRRLAGLPPLGWLLSTTEQGGASLLIGEDVEELPGGIVEGAWDGPFEERAPEQAEHLFGSGVLVDGDGRLTILTAKHSLEGVYLLEHKPTGRTFVSNSLALALAAADVRLTNFLSRASRSIAGGFHRFKTRLLDTDEVTVHKLVYYNYTLSADGSAVRLPLPEARTFGSYEEYRAAMAEAVAKVARNGGHPERRRRYELLTTVSGGYDSTACSVLAREAGCERAATVHTGRRGWNDTGRHVAEALGMSVIERDRPDFPEKHEKTQLTEPRLREMAAEFLASGTGGDDAIFLAFEDVLPGTMLVTGHGGGYWNIDVKPSTDARRRDVSGSSMSDFRLRLGFISFPIPFLFVRSQPDVRLIGKSAEMRPWAVGGAYDRPVPRRMVEEAGVPREAFGQRKMAACIVFDGVDAPSRWALTTVADRYAEALASELTADARL